MKTMMILTAILASLNTLSPARADGHGPGNGGSVYVCNGGKKVQLIDLIEPSLRVGLKNFIQTQESNELVERQVERAFHDLGQFVPKFKLEQKALTEWKNFRKNIEWRSGQFEWKLSDDIGMIPIPENCEIKNAIMYLSDAEISGQSRFRDKMSPTHQAALEVHEVLYKMMRDMGSVKDAVPARRLTLLLFSNLRQDQELGASLVASYLRPREGFTSEIEIDPTWKGKGNVVISVLNPNTAKLIDTVTLFGKDSMDGYAGADFIETSDDRKGPSFFSFLGLPIDRFQYGDSATAAFSNANNDSVFRRHGLNFRVFSQTVTQTKKDGTPRRVEYNAIGPANLALPKTAELQMTRWYPITVYFVSTRLKKFVVGDLR